MDSAHSKQSTTLLFLAAPLVLLGPWASMCHESTPLAMIRLELPKTQRTRTLRCYHENDRSHTHSVMNVDSGFLTTQRIIWEANREDPVELNATLSGFLTTLASDGDPVLRDRNGRLVWSTGTANRGATRVEVVRETGNLVVFRNNTTLWQSFDRPTDTLMAAAVLNGDGLNLVLNMMLSNDTAPSGTRSQALCGLNATGGLLPTRSSANTPRNQSFIRLEFDGDLHAYTLENLLIWSDSYNLLTRNDSCLLPQHCQPFGICSSSACVGCLDLDGTTAGWTDTRSALGALICASTNQCTWLSRALGNSAPGAKCIEIGLPELLLIVLTQGIGLMLNGLFGTITRSAVSVDCMSHLSPSDDF
ncbi:hypothetical protein SELMODRAFT_426634 [Selaginella moellendorffii]|uniref:Bulb-type lectin domain-containing protein n=1 Tax=Selaginella moellendorffii TaxID=88036 RepID=D8SX03_SELML|nr:hypothetical protein SELMODRAFT_426634 [Selaginella moellendorffii]